jgi:hypothetical protein
VLNCVFIYVFAYVELVWLPNSLPIYVELARRLFLFETLDAFNGHLVHWRSSIATETTFVSTKWSCISDAVR